MRAVRDAVKEPISNGAPAVSVVVAVPPPERLEFVPQAKPRMVDEALPSAVMEPFRVAPVVDIPVTEEVVTEGTTTVAIGVTAFEADDGELVPTAFTAYTAKVYEVLLVRPLTTIGEPVEVAVKLPGVEDAK